MICIDFEDAPLGFSISVDEADYEIDEMARERSVGEECPCRRRFDRKADVKAFAIVITDESCGSLVGCRYAPPAPSSKVTSSNTWFGSPGSCGTVPRPSGNTRARSRERHPGRSGLGADQAGSD